MKFTLFTILTILYFFFTATSPIQSQSGCSGINFNVQIIGPCHYRLIVTNTSNCFPFLYLVLNEGEFENWHATNGWSAEQIEPAYVVLTHSSGQIPTGASTPFDFFLPQGIAPVLTLSWDDTCPPGKGCFAEVPLESCFIPADACITGVNYVDVECTHLPYTNQPKLSDRTVRLLDAMGNTLQTTTTNATGAYSFCDLPAGNYVVKITNPADWTAGVPASGQYAVTLGQSQTLVRNFGSCRVNCLCSSVVTTVTQGLSGGPNQCCYSLTTQGLNGGAYCFQFVDLQVDAGQFISPSTVQAGWVFNQIGPQYIQVIPPTGFVPTGTSLAGAFCVSGVSPHHITATAGFNDSAGAHECSTLFNFNCSNIVNPCPTSTPRITHVAGNPDAFSGEVDLNPGTSVISAVWDFGDGTRDSSCCLGDVSHLFEPGTYNVCLAVRTANGAGETCNSSVCTEVVVTPLTSPCDDVNVFLTNSAIGNCCFDLNLFNTADATFTSVDITLSSGNFVNSVFGSGLWDFNVNGNMASITQSGGGLFPIGSYIPVTICDPGGVNPYTVDVDFPYNGGACHQTLIMDCAPTNCSCSGFQNLAFYNFGNIPDIPVACNGTITLPCVPSDGGYWFRGDFSCQGNCIPTVNYNISSLNGYTFSGSVSGTSSFIALTGLPLGPGDYQMTLSGLCGGNTCTCVINFTVPNNCGCCSQSPLDFSYTVDGGVNISHSLSDCKAVVVQIGNLPCQRVDWIDWGDLNISTGPFTSGAAFTHNYTQNGTYTITYQVTEINPVTGGICYQQIFIGIRTIHCPCSCGTFDMQLSVAGSPAQTVLCGSTWTLGLNEPFTLSTAFQCQGNFCPPTAQVDWVLTGPGGNQLGSATATPGFVITPVNPGDFALPGLYTLTLTSHCDQNQCNCVIYFQVTDPCCTSQAIFLAEAANVQTNRVVNHCSISMEAVGMTGCMQITYDWGDGQTTGPITGNNVPVNHTYTVPGTYNVCYTIEQIDFFGNVCWNYQYCEQVTASCQNACPCLGFSNLVLTPGPTGGPLNVNCSDNIIQSCQPGVTYTLTGTMPCGCVGSTSVINWQLFGPQGLVDAGSTIGNPAFTIPLPSGYFYAAGTYSLVMSGNCTDMCPCTIYFAISQPCPALCPCDLADFQADVAAGFFTKNYFVNCKSCFKGKDLGACDMVEWSVDNAPYSAPIPGTQQYCFNFSGNGTHDIKMRVTRKKGVNLICGVATFQKTITVNCLPIIVTHGPRNYSPVSSDGPTRPLAPHDAMEQRNTVAEWAEVTAIRIFPNPNFGTFSVELPEPALEGMRFRLMSPTGRMVGEQTLQAGNTQQTVQAKDLPGGIYFLQLLWEGKMIAVEKFVKQ